MEHVTTSPRTLTSAIGGGADGGAAIGQLTVLLDELSARLVAVDLDLAHAAETLVETTSTLTAELHDQAEAACAAWRDMAAELDHQGHATNARAESVEGLGIEVRSAMSATREDGDRAAAEASRAFEDATLAVTRSHRQQTVLQADAATSFEDLGRSGQTWLEQVTRDAHQGGSAVQAMAEHVHGPHRQDTRSAFDELGAALQGTIEDHVVAGLMAAGSAAEAAHQRLSELVQTSGGHLGDVIDQVLGAATAHVGDALTDRLSRGLEEVVVEGIECLVAEVAEHAAELGAGAATTSMLAPILPELALAKKIVSSVNDLIDAVF